MTDLLSKAGREFLRAFLAGVIVYSAGVWTAPNLNQAYAIGIAAIAASLSAGFSAIQLLVPQIQFGGQYGELLNVFVRSGLANFLTVLIGILNAPHLVFDRSAAVGLITGAIATGVRALQGFLTPGEFPNPKLGFKL